MDFRNLSLLLFFSVQQRLHALDLDVIHILVVAVRFNVTCRQLFFLARNIYNRSCFCVLVDPSFLCLRSLQSAFAVLSVKHIGNIRVPREDLLSPGSTVLGLLCETAVLSACVVQGLWLLTTPRRLNILSAFCTGWHLARIYQHGVIPVSVH